MQNSTKPEKCRDNHSTTVHSCPVIRARTFLYLLIEGDEFVIDVQKLPSAISTNPLIAGVGWGDMFHLVVYFGRF